MLKLPEDATTVWKLTLQESLFTMESSISLTPNTGIRRGQLLFPDICGSKFCERPIRVHTVEISHDSDSIISSMTGSQESPHFVLETGYWSPKHPQDGSGQWRKLSRPWHGPYRVTNKTDPDITYVKVHSYQPSRFLLEYPAKTPLIPLSRISTSNSHILDRALRPTGAIQRHMPLQLAAIHAPSRYYTCTL